jgi:hypothetical protein
MRPLQLGARARWPTGGMQSQPGGQLGGGGVHPHEIDFLIPESGRSRVPASRSWGRIDFATRRRPPPSFPTNTTPQGPITIECPKSHNCLSISSLSSKSFNPYVMKRMHLNTEGMGRHPTPCVKHRKASQQKTWSIWLVFHMNSGRSGNTCTPGWLIMFPAQFGFPGPRGCPREAQNTLQNNGRPLKCWRLGASTAKGLLPCHVFWASQVPSRGPGKPT